MRNERQKSSSITGTTAAITARRASARGQSTPPSAVNGE
jgi:hypothetical protein